MYVSYLCYKFLKRYIYSYYSNNWAAHNVNTYFKSWSTRQVSSLFV